MKEFTKSSGCPLINQYFLKKLINDNTVTFPLRVSLLMHIFS